MSARPRVARRRVTVADYTGLTAAAAVEAARTAGLRPAPERVEVADAVAHGLVVAHEPKADSEATRGTILTLYVGAPPARPDSDFDDLPVEGNQTIETVSFAEAVQDRPVESSGGSETDFGLRNVVPEIAGPEAPALESPLAPPAREEAAPGSDDRELHQADRKPQRRPRRKLALAAVAVIGLLFLTAALTSQKPSTPKPVLRPTPSAGAPASRRRDRDRTKKPNRARGAPRRRPRIRPAVVPRSPIPATPAPTRALPAPSRPARRTPDPLGPGSDEFF